MVGLEEKKLKKVINEVLDERREIRKKNIDKGVRKLRIFGWTFMLAMGYYLLITGNSSAHSHYFIWAMGAGTYNWLTIIFDKDTEKEVKHGRGKRSKGRKERS